jgi:GDP-D-mannose dehydratase
MCHFAQASNGLSYNIPRLTLDSNVFGNLDTLEAITRLELKTGVLLTVTSTKCGRTVDTLKVAIPENAHRQPVTQQGFSKVAIGNLGLPVAVDIKSFFHRELK